MGRPDVPSVRDLLGVGHGKERKGGEKLHHFQLTIIVCEQDCLSY